VSAVAGTVVSRDGTPIAFERTGDGPALILVDGALCSRRFGPMPQLAPLLAGRFTVFTYDRRGRGESGDRAPYAVEREIDDLEALIREAGGSAFVYGISSGAALALDAANHGLAIPRLALYEAPFIVDDTRPPLPPDYMPTLQRLIASDRRGDAVKLFMRAVQVPRIAILLMPVLPSWRKLKAVAHTLWYDMTIVEPHQRGRPLPSTRWSRVTMPTLAIAGGKSPAWMQNAMAALAAVVPGARHRVLDGQTHMVHARTLAPLLLEFFGGVTSFFIAFFVL
jgi:pimeloyl-ACP methyl ester carboxylesterase